MVILWMLTGLMTVSPLWAKEWRGISPLHSTRGDVVRLFGPSKTEVQNTSSYEFEGESVILVYSTGSCKDEPNGWNVPKDTVTGMLVAPKVKPKFADLKLDANKFVRVPEGDYHAFMIYKNDEEGIGYVVNEPEGLVDSVRYWPAAKDNHLRCPANSKFQGGVESTRKFDEYSNIPLEEEERRLNDFATQLREYEPEANGYIIVYAGRQPGAGVVRERIDRVMEYLVFARGINPTRLLTLEGGLRERLTVELWIRPKGFLAPTIAPTPLKPLPQ